MISTSVCIATYRRSGELERLLESLTRQVEAPAFEVIVVDNDPQESARPTVEKFASMLAITYCREEIAGVAAVRNRAVGASRGAYLAFVDDDEWARPDWLATLHRVMAETQADGVFGAIYNQFDPAVPQHIRACGFFDAALLADRSEIPWWGTRTGNAYIRRSALPDAAAPFDLQYGLTGGEDTHMFKCMQDRGARLVWSAEAVVDSFHPPARANLRWVLKRALRYGGTGAEVEWLGLPLQKRVRRGLRSATTAMKEFCGAAIGWGTDKTQATRRLITAAMAIGRLGRLLGYRVQIYRRPGPARNMLKG